MALSVDVLAAHFARLHIEVKDDWLAVVAEWISTQWRPHFADSAWDSVQNQLCSVAVDQFLSSELAASSKAVFSWPQDGRSAISGFFVFEVKSAIDISTSMWTQLRAETHQDADFGFFEALANDEETVDGTQAGGRQRASARGGNGGEGNAWYSKKAARMILFELSDGRETIRAIEYRSIPAITLPIAPGAKLLLHGTIRSRNRILWLTAANCQLLGGECPSYRHANRLEAVLGRRMGLEKYLNEQPPPNTAPDAPSVSRPVGNAENAPSQDLQRLTIVNETQRLPLRPVNLVTPQATSQGQSRPPTRTTVVQAPDNVVYDTLAVAGGQPAPRTSLPPLLSNLRVPSRPRNTSTVQGDSGQPAEDPSLFQRPSMASVAQRRSDPVGTSLTTSLDSPRPQQTLPRPSAVIQNNDDVVYDTMAVGRGQPGPRTSLPPLLASLREPRRSRTMAPVQETLAVEEDPEEGPSVFQRPSMDSGVRRRSDPAGLKTAEDVVMDSAVAMDDRMVRGSPVTGNGLSSSRGSGGGSPSARHGGSGDKSFPKNSFRNLMRQASQAHHPSPSTSHRTTLLTEDDIESQALDPLPPPPLEENDFEWSDDELDEPKLPTRNSTTQPATTILGVPRDSSTPKTGTTQEVERKTTGVVSPTFVNPFAKKTPSTGPSGGKRPLSVVSGQKKATLSARTVKPEPSSEEDDILFVKEVSTRSARFSPPSSSRQDFEDASSTTSTTLEAFSFASPKVKRQRSLATPTTSKNLSFNPSTAGNDDDPLVQKFRQLKLFKITEAIRKMRFSLGSQRMHVCAITQKILEPFRIEDNEWTMKIRIFDESSDGIACFVAHSLLCDLITMTPLEATAIKNSTNLEKRREGTLKMQSLDSQIHRCDLVFEIEFFTGNRATPKIVGLQTLAQMLM